MNKRIVIADDHASIRDMLVWILMQERCYDIIGEAGSGLDAIKVCCASEPDLLILDLILPCISGVEVLRRVRRELPRTRVMVYSGTCNGALIKEALREQPHGYVEKLEGLSILRKAIASVAHGGNYFSPEANQILSRDIGKSPENDTLSPREREILQLVAEGRSSKEISVLLNVSRKTVENHRANLMEKLNMHDVANLTLYAVRHGLVQIE